MKPWKQVCAELDLLLGDDPNLVPIWRIYWFVLGRTIVMTVWIVAVIALGQAVDFAWRALDSFRSRWTLITSAVEVLGLVLILSSAWTIFWHTPEDSSVVAFAIRQIALSLGGMLLILVGRVFYLREDEKCRELKLRD